jgi:hypothetical protein
MSEGKDLISVPRVVRVSCIIPARYDLTTNPLAVMIVSLPEIITILHIYDLPDPHHNKAQQGTGPSVHPRSHFTLSKSSMSTFLRMDGRMNRDFVGGLG